MSRKTYIKIKRGFITDPKHRIALGSRVWLYLYMLDIADWETGQIFEWRDKDAADELQMPLITIRVQRRQLEEDDYISCCQHANYQTITIKRWVNPKSDNFVSPSDFTDIEGDIESDIKGNQNLSPLHINQISDTIIKDNNIKESDKNMPPIHDNTQILFQIDDSLPFADQILKAYNLKKGATRKPYAAFDAMCVMFQDVGVTIRDYLESIDELEADGRYGNAASPTSVEKWAINKAKKRNKGKPANSNNLVDDFRESWGK